jgi:hypothetical protein
VSSSWPHRRAEDLEGEGVMLGRGNEEEGEGEEGEEVGGLEE